MTIEQNIQDLIGALDRNTAALTRNTELAANDAPKGGGRKKAADKEPAATQPVTTTTTTATQVVPPPPVEQVNAAILALAKVNRDKAVEVLSKFGVTRTPELKPENYQAAIDLAEEEKAKIDAAATQQSLV